jgi:hypothetical protein
MADCSQVNLRILTGRLHTSNASAGRCLRGARRGRYNLRNNEWGTHMADISAVLVFAGLLCILIRAAALFHHRHVSTRERLDMKRHLQRIGAEGQHGSIFEPTARS